VPSPESFGHRDGQFCLWVERVGRRSGPSSGQELQQGACCGLGLRQVEVRLWLRLAFAACGARKGAENEVKDVRPERVLEAEVRRAVEPPPPPSLPEERGGASSAPEERRSIRAAFHATAECPLS
jgi:hypothetical protein